MEKIEIKNLASFLFGLPIIGIGRSAVCFKLNKEEVLKLYILEFKNQLFAYYNMEEQIEKMHTIGNFSFIVPNKIYTYRGEVIGYSLYYVPAKAIAHLRKDMHLFDFVTPLKYLKEDTYRISQKNWLLDDVHYRNILFNNFYSVIDLDFGYFSKDKNIFLENGRQIILPIIGSFFGENLFDSRNSIKLQFYQKHLDMLYQDIINKGKMDLNDFFHEMEEEIKIKNPTIAELKKVRKKLYHSSHDYYHF